MGEPPDRLASTAATKSGVATVQKVRLQQSKYWRCLYPKNNDQGSFKLSTVCHLQLRLMSSQISRTHWVRSECMVNLSSNLGRVKKPDKKFS